MHVEASCHITASSTAATIFDLNRSLRSCTQSGCILYSQRNGNDVIAFLRVAVSCNWICGTAIGAPVAERPHITGNAAVIGRC